MIFPKGRGQSPLVMGILNLTPDSFSDGGRWNDTDSALKHAAEMVEQGASILDVGAESTRPGCTPVSSDEEWSRLEPVLKELKGIVDVPISVDTMKAEVAENHRDILQCWWRCQEVPAALHRAMRTICISVAESFVKRASRPRSPEYGNSPNRSDSQSGRLGLAVRTVRTKTILRER